MLARKFLELGEGDPVTIYDLKYMDKEKAVMLRMKYKQKNVNVIERIVTIPAYAEVNTIL